MELAVITNNGKDLKEHERSWLEAYMEHGNAAEASRSVGQTESCVRQHGYRMKRRLSECIQANLHKLIGKCTPDALETVYDIACNCPDPKVRLSAAQDILNRAGYTGTKKVEVSINDKSDDEINREISMLLNKGGIVDAEVVE